MIWSDRTVLGTTFAVVVIAILNFFVPDWVRQIGLLSMAIGSVALGLLVLWRSGLISFGHALYFGLGAYALRLFQWLGRHQIDVASLGWHESDEWWHRLLVSIQFDKFIESIWNPFWRMMDPLTTDAFFLVICAAVIAGLFAWLLGFMVRRYRAIFFALLTMAFSMILWGILAKEEKFGSTDGLNIYPPTFFGYAPQDQAAQIALFLFSLVIIYLLIIAVQFYLRSVLGEMTMAVRENEIRVEYLGYSVERVIHFKYVISGVLAGFGGAIMALAVGQIDPEAFVYWSASGEFVFVAILAGTANVAAPFVGAVVFEVIRHFAWQEGANLWQLIMGGTLLAIIMFMPNGIWSLIQRLSRKKGGMAGT